MGFLPLRSLKFQAVVPITWLIDPESLPADSRAP